MRCVAVAAVTGTVFGLVGAPPAGAQPNTWPPVPPQCGANTDADLLWEAAQNAQPDEDFKVHGNYDVEIPNNDRARGYIVHHGKKSDSPTPQAFDILVIPTTRVSGIECYNLLASNTPDFFKDAYEAKMWLPLNTEPAMGVNSTYARGLNQLHIHLSKLTPAARKDIDKGIPNYAANANEWFDPKHRIKIGGHTYRAWNASDLNHNFFARLNDEIVKKINSPGISMADQTMLIVPSHGPAGGFVVLNSDTLSGLDSGTNNSDFMLDRDADPLKS